ncbi:MAG: Rieske (2Fe-2S) protein [Thermomonas sp.]
MSSSLNDGLVLAALETLPRDGLLAVDAPLDGEAAPLILHRAADGGVRAWLNVCPHAGRRLDYAPGMFLRGKAGELVCAVHGASFALDDGCCVAGPCRGQSLRAVAVHCADGQVRLGAAPADQ